MRAFTVAVLLACSLLAAALVCERPRDAQAQVYRPNPSPTAKYDVGVLGLPQPSPVPSCTSGIAFTYADANGCIYSCSGGKTSILARSLSNTCAVATTGATATPTATPTSTP